MGPSQAVHLGLKLARIDFAASVPCVNLCELLQLVDSNSGMIHVPVTREEEGVGICAGHGWAENAPMLLMQNSGLGNSINALASLDLLYKIPLLMVISHRGCVGETIAGQVPMGQLSQSSWMQWRSLAFLPCQQMPQETVDAGMEDIIGGA